MSRKRIAETRKSLKIEKIDMTAGGRPAGACRDVKFLIGKADTGERRRYRAVACRGGAGCLSNMVLHHLVIIIRMSL